MNNQFLGHDISRRAVLVGSAGTLSAVFLTGCQPSTLVTILGDVVTAAEFALPVIGAAVGLPPAVLAGIVSYLQLVDTAVTQATVILAGPGTVAQKAAQIIAAFAGIAQGCGCIPAGTPQAVVSAIGAVIAAIEKFLGNFKPSSVLMAQPAKAIPVSGRDEIALTAIRTRAQVHMLKLQELKK